MGCYLVAVPYQFGNCANIIHHYAGLPFDCTVVSCEDYVRELTLASAHDIMVLSVRERKNMWCILYRVIQLFDDGTKKKIGDFKYEQQAQEYIDTHEGRFTIIDWDCS